MAGPLILAADRIRADVAGITGPVERTLPAATSVTERVSSVLHGESGGLGFLFDHLYTMPASGAAPVGPGPGPHGGTASLPSVTPPLAPATPPTEPRPAPVAPSAPGAGLSGLWQRIKAGPAPGAPQPGSPTLGDRLLGR